MAKPVQEKKPANIWFYNFLKQELGRLENNPSKEFRKEEFAKFLEKHTEFLSEELPLEIFDSSSKKTQSEQGYQNGKSEIVGKVRLSDDNISTWIKPELIEKGVIFCDLQTAWKDYPLDLETCFSRGKLKRDSLISRTALAFNRIGVFLSIPENVMIEGTFLFEIAYSMNNVLIPLQFITSVGKSASSNILIDYSKASKKDGKLIIFSKNDYLLGQNARLHIFSNQNCDKNSAIFIDEKIIQEKDSSSEFFSLDMGASVVERLLSVDLQGEGAGSIITGVYKPENGEKYYFDTEQNHKASNTISDLQYKGVSGKNTYTSWKGNIVVDQKTTGANGYQANNNLIVDESAKVESVPGLEIRTDDVRCSHGVTIGNIDKNQMFYLQSRGINDLEAENLIVEGFLTSAKRRIKNSILLEIASRFF